MAAIELNSTPLRTDANLVAYWRLEGNSNDALGTYNGSDTSITYGTDYGKFNQGASFGGTSKINIGDYDAFSFNASQIISISFWFKAPDNTNNRAMFVEKSNWTTAAYEWACFNDDADHLQFQCWTSAGANAMTVKSSNTWFDNAWHHAVFLADGSKGYIYVDGSNDSGSGSSFVASMSNTTAPLTFGLAPGLTPGYSGSLDDIAIFNRVLTPTEISNLYNGTWTSIKTANGLAKASVKTINGLAIASVKTVNGLA